jgi:hypothetical protein
MAAFTMTHYEFICVILVENLGNGSVVARGRQNVTFLILNRGAWSTNLSAPRASGGKNKSERS